MIRPGLNAEIGDFFGNPHAQCFGHLISGFGGNHHLQFSLEIERLETGGTGFEMGGDMTTLFVGEFTIEEGVDLSEGPFTIEGGVVVGHSGLSGCLDISRFRRGLGKNFRLRRGLVQGHSHVTAFAVIFFPDGGES